MPQSYTLELKKKIVRLHEEEGRTCKSITAEYGVSKASISKWCREFSEECQAKALENSNSPNELELMKENLRRKKELSEGSVHGFCRKFSELSGTEIEKLEEHLISQPVVATDAMTVSLNGKQSYIRNISDEKTVVYYSMEKQTKKAYLEISEKEYRRNRKPVVKRAFRPVM